MTTAAHPAAPPSILGATLAPLAFEAVPGFEAPDLTAFTRAYARGCRAVSDAASPLRAGAPTPEALRAACAAYLAAPAADAEGIRGHLRAFYDPYEVRPDAGAPFATGYFEPVLDASPAEAPGFPVPVLGRPADLGTVEPYPDRRAIEEGALAGRGLEIAWLRDPVDLFMAQVQGSARLRFPGGGTSRLRYAGRNGRPYSSIGRALIASGAIARDAMSLEALTGWLRANPGEGREVMRGNESYVFFARDDALDPALGPVGGQGVPLEAGASIAVDRGLWPYGLPFALALDAPRPGGGAERIERLAAAQDTGTAIVGPGRIDLYVGSGAAAGTSAGLIRHPFRLVVFWPRG